MSAGARASLAALRRSSGRAWGLALGSALALLLGASSASAQSLQTLAVDFKRTTSSGGAERTIEGTLYFTAPNTLIIVTSRPVLQWSVFLGKDLLIYYPRERKAFRFVSRNRLLIPFAQSFIGLVKEDFGLADAGFSLREHRRQAGLLTTVWSPPKPMRSLIGKAVAGTDGGRPVVLEIYDPKNNLVASTTYSAYVQQGPILLPGRASAFQKTPDGEVREEFFYFGHRVNVPLPPEVLDFRLPESVNVQELAW